MQGSGFWPGAWYASPDVFKSSVEGDIPVNEL